MYGKTEDFSLRSYLLFLVMDEVMRDRQDEEVPSFMTVRDNVMLAEELED